MHRTHAQIPDDSCSRATKPPSAEACNIQDCPKWIAGEWSGVSIIFNMLYFCFSFFFGSTILCAYIRVLFRQQYTLYIYMHFFFVPCTGKIKCTHTSGTYSVAVMRVHMRIGYVYSCVSIIFPFICCNPETASNSFFGAQNQRAMTWQMSSLHVYAACVRCCFHCAPSDRALLCVFVYAFRNAHVSECLCLCTGSHERMNLFGLQSSRILLKFRSLSSSQHYALSLSLTPYSFFAFPVSLHPCHELTHARTQHKPSSYRYAVLCMLHTHRHNAMCTFHSSFRLFCNLCCFSRWYAK